MTNELLTQAVSEVEWVDAPRALREAFPVRRPNCDPRVPYERLELCVQDAWCAFPDARKIVSIWNPQGTNEVCAEVWTDRGAQVYSHAGILARMAR